MTSVTTSPLGQLTRKPERRGDRALLDEVFDTVAVATVSTVLGDEPWAVPMLVARDGDRVLLHGSTGAGALRHIAAGAKVCVSAFLFDALVIAERQFDHSANYRSAVVRGVARVVGGSEKPALLDRFTEALIPGRVAECPPHSAKELASTLLLEVPIADGFWVVKARTGPASQGQAWTGVVPVHTGYGAPVSDSALPLPPSVQRLVDGD